ncbi:hypothetical protein [Steroidobacter gossypii]|uniref:hypothetical protein n=1 Tax=Steroidobacter gossypii TaxID=2805490 RepID=UPI0019332696|nr:hypothetical protein [Steroidobacter gossypii]
MKLFEIEIDRVAWRELRTMGARGGQVPDAPRELLTASDAQDAERGHRAHAGDRHVETSGCWLPD